MKDERIGHQEDEHIESWLSVLKEDAPLLDEALLNSVRDRLALADARANERPLRRWNNNLRRFKVAASLAIAVGTAALLMWVFAGSGGSRLAFADVIRQMRQSRTVQYRSTFTRADGSIESRRMFLKEPALSRVESSDKIDIADSDLGKSLLLLPAQKIVIASDLMEGSRKQNVYEDLLSMVGADAQNLGSVKLDGKDLLLFRRHNLLAWVDPKTYLPVRFELEYVGEDGRKSTELLIDFVFNAPLDDSLFSLTPPADYYLAPVTSDPVTASIAALKAMLPIRKALFQYAESHHDAFPDDLNQLASYGITAQSLVNPGRPHQYPGFIYVKPLSDDPRQIIMYEAYDRWDRAINVAFNDGHTDCLGIEANFLKQLEATKRKNSVNSKKR